MELSTFIQDLISSGEVSITGSINAFTASDLATSERLLQQLYRDAALECAAPIPPFEQDVALAAARFLYIAIQLTVLREEGEDSIRQNLHLAAPGSAAEMFSADLMLHYLPQLFQLAQGLAPSDLLVQKLKETAREWPLSSVGLKMDEPADLHLILQHPALKQLYTDRIIQHQDKSKTSPPEIKAFILSTTGEHTTQFWPGFDNS